MAPDLPDLPVWELAIQITCPKYGLNWLGMEKFPIDTKDFAPIISRVLTKNPDVIDTSSTGGSMVGMCALLIKQLREAGFKGIIMIPAIPPLGVVTEVVPKEYLTKIVTNVIDVNSSIVTEAYRDAYSRAKNKFDQIPDPYVLVCYDIMKPFLEFLNGQNTMDTTVWMEGFANYHWQSLYGFEKYWLGKKVWGIDRRTFIDPWVSEYKDGKLEANFRGKK